MCDHGKEVLGWITFLIWYTVEDQRPTRPVSLIMRGLPTGLSSNLTNKFINKNYKSIKIELKNKKVRTFISIEILIGWEKYLFCYDFVIKNVFRGTKNFPDNRLPLIKQ